MEHTNNQNTIFNATSLFEFFWRWRKALIIIGISAAVVSSIVSLLIREKYRSTVIMFPVSTNAISRSLLAEDVTDKQDVLQFGEEEQAEQMLQILNSDNIRSKICDKYKLMQHYEIDPKDPYKQTKLYETFNENISFKRTEFMSVKVDVMDHDKQMAADIANDIAALLDSTKRDIQNERITRALKIVEGEYLSRKIEVERMEDSLHALNLKGMFDYESQSERINEQYAIALAKGDQRAIKLLEEQRDIIANYGSAYMALRENLYIRREQLNIIKKKYDEIKIDAGQTLPFKFVVNKAYAAERKSYPVRWLIVAVSTITSVIFGILLLILFDNIRRMRNQERTTQS